MGWTKREIVEDMFGEIALAGYVFDLSPEELQAALRKLDTMMASWMALGINLGYAMGTTPNGSDLDADSGLPLFAIEAVVLNGAIRLAAGKGKALSASTRTTAKSAYDAVVLACAKDQVQEQQRPSTMPRGAGGKPWRSGAVQPFMGTPDTDPLTTSDDGGLVFTGI